MKVLLPPIMLGHKKSGSKVNIKDLEENNKRLNMKSFQVYELE